MKGFIKLTKEKNTIQIRVAVHTIANYERVKYPDGTFHNKVVYRNTGLINSTMMISESIETIDRLIKEANK